MIHPKETTMRAGNYVVAISTVTPEGQDERLAVRKGDRGVVTARRRASLDVTFTSAAGYRVDMRLSLRNADLYVALDLEREALRAECERPVPAGC
jgi:hypothetical protein